MVSTALDRLPVEVLLGAYRQGLFPMCHEDGELYWHDPDPRAIFHLDRVRPDNKSRSLMRRERFRVTIDTAFEPVVRACADRPTTWIDERLIHSYVDLHAAGHAHSVECWDGDTLVGGLYGLAIGSAFFGESMFSRLDNAGKVAFHHLVGHLCQRGFELFDTQYINAFTRELGAVEVPRAHYRAMLATAIGSPVRFLP